MRQLLLWEQEEYRVEEFEAIAEKIEDFNGKIASAICNAVNEAKFGAQSIEDLDSLGKTVVGARVEEHIRKGLAARPGIDCDCLLEGVEFDIKTTVRKNWMISPTQVRIKSILLLLEINDRAFSCGVIRAEEKFLSSGKNRDKKRSLSKSGKSNINWLVRSLNYSNLSPK